MAQAKVSLKSIYTEIKSLRRELELVKSALIPEVEINDEERAEIRKIRDEVKRGERVRLDDALAELNV